MGGVPHLEFTTVGGGFSVHDFTARKGHLYNDIANLS